jgi:transposase
MKSNLLSQIDRAFVEEARGNTRDKRTYMKLSVLVMLDEGHTQMTVAVALGIGLGTVNNCKQKYEDDGLDKYLDTHYVPYQGRLSDEQLAQLDNYVEQGLYSTCACIIDWVKQSFDVEYSQSGMRSILHQLGFTYKKTTAVPGGASPVAQEAFLKQLEPFLTEEVSSNDVILFMDAVHPQHNTRSDYAWIKVGQKKEVPSNTGRKRININGAMNAQHPEEVTIIEADTINAQATQKLFERLLQRYQEKDTIYILADNARYYSSQILKEWLEQNPKIQLLHLPPYSPNLNLIERLWKFMRKKVINLHYYKEFEAFRSAVLNFFEHIGQYKDDLKTLITPNFQRFSAQPKTQHDFSQPI